VASSFNDSWPPGTTEPGEQMSNQPEWIPGHDGNWIMNEARIEPVGERYILNVSGMVVQDFDSFEEARQYHCENFLIKPQ
jgi:hypothetical protein